MASIAVSEVDMDRFDTEIPQIAAEATHQAYWESLQQTGKVVELRDGSIVETTMRNGEQTETIVTGESVISGAISELRDRVRRKK